MHELLNTHHKALSAYYPHVLTLKSWMTSQGVDVITFPNDPPEYLGLIDETLCASISPFSSLSPLHGSAGLDRQDVDRTVNGLDRILEEVAKRDGPKNVILNGLKYSYTSGDLPINTSRPMLENRHANNPASIFRSVEWRIFRKRVGDGIFRHLLLNTSIFLLLKNNCYIQLSGKPIYDLYEKSGPNPNTVARGKKRNASDSSSAPTTRKHRKRIKRDKEEEDVDVLRKMMKAERGLKTADRMIYRGKMFYGDSCRKGKGKAPDGLPHNHILNKLKPQIGQIPSDQACLRLLEEIFTSIHHTSTDSGQRLESYSRLMGMMREIIVRHQGLDYSRPLRQCKKRQPGLTEGLEPVSHHSVFRYIKSVIRQVFPESIMGTNENLATLLRNVRGFIDMKQHESSNLHLLFQGIKVNDFEWLSLPTTEIRLSLGQAKRKRTIVEDFIFWIFDGFLIPLLKNTFYITETSSTKYETIFYFQSDWYAASQPHFDNLKEGGFLEKLDRAESFYAKSAVLGVSAVRLVPKPGGGFRPIVNLGRKLNNRNLGGIPIFGSNRSLTANQVLKGVHQILTFEKERHREQLGCTLFGTNEVFKPIQKLKADLLRIHGRVPKLYFVKMDIKSAFDTIKQDKVLDLIANLLDQDHDYVLMLYALLLPPASKASQGTPRRLFKLRADVNDGQSNSFGQHASTVASGFRNAAIIDMMRRKHVTRESALELLKKHIKENIWEIDNELYKQKEGIPQGSKISSLLCSLFYAALEVQDLGFVNKHGSRLLRYIDDFLLITDDCNVATRFVERMQAGFPEYGAFVAENKTLLSFEYAMGSQVAPVRLSGVEVDDYFPYCGFLIDMKTLDISMDYSRMIGIHMKQSFSLRNTRHLEAGFIGWFSRQLENRNQIAYLDSKHNNLDTVRVNVFLNFALTSMKIPHYFKIETDGLISERLADLIFDSVAMSVEYTYIAGKARVNHHSRGDRRNHYQISRTDFDYIAYSAMGKVFSRKISRFKPIVKRLKDKISKRKYDSVRDRLHGLIDNAWRTISITRF